MLVPQGCWSRATHSRERDIHGTPEAAITHLGTVTLKDSVEYLPAHSNTLRPTQGRVGRVKIAKLASERASEMSLANDSAQQTACRGHEERLPGAWATPSFMRPAGMGCWNRHHKVSLQTAKGASKFPAPKGCWRALLRGFA